jgi:RNA polymerase sigma-B factor
VDPERPEPEGAPGHDDQSGAAAEELFRRLRQTGDPRARDELVRRYLRLARRLAARYANPYESLEDLEQVASIGLLGAIDRFDPDRGVAFTSFAVPTIVGELKRHFRGTGWSAHVPRRAQELALRVDTAIREISARTGEAPAVDELASHLKLSTDDVVTGLDAGMAHYSVSLDAPAPATGGDAEPEPLVSRLGSVDESYDLTETTLTLSAALRRLPDLERQALTLRLSGDLKQTEIAERMGCSQMQVSRLLRRGAVRLRELTAAD